MIRQGADGERAQRRAGRRRRHLSPTSRIHLPFTLVLLLAAALCLLAPAAQASQTYDPPVTTLVSNMGQSSGTHMTFFNAQSGVQQRFETGPNPAGYQLEGIWLRVDDTFESRYMTIDANLYRVGGGLYHHVANLSRGQLNDYAENEWRAPADTYMEPDTVYVFLLDCVRGCANDNVAEFATTPSDNEDSGAEAGWSVEGHFLWRKAQNSAWYREPDYTLKMRVKGRPSPHRAYRTEIISSPRDGDTYRLGEHIDIALTYNTPVYVAPSDPTSIDIQVGDGEDGSVYRAATYASGQFTTRLVYRYQVQLGDLDNDGISIDTGSSSAGYSGWVPTLVYSLGLLPVDRHYPGLSDDGRHKVDGSFEVTAVDITSTPAHADGYRLGEDIEVTLTFSADAYVPEGDSSIAIRVGDAAGAANDRAARYVSGSGTRRLVYRYSVQYDDYDADGISVDVGVPDSGFSGRLPVTSPALGSVPVERAYPGVAEDAIHKVDRAMTAAFDATALTVSEGGTAESVTVVLDTAPSHVVIIPIVVALGDGATADDYTLSASSAIFEPGEKEKSLTLMAVDDGEDDDGETLTIAFGALPSGVRAGDRSSVSVAIADDDGDATGQTVTIRPGRDAYIAGLDDIVFNLTLAEAADRAIRVNLRLTQDQPFLDSADLLQQVEFAAHATAAELRVPASRQNPNPAQGGTLTATLVLGYGYHVGTPAAAYTRMAASIPALIARLSQTSYSFDEGASGAEASVDVVMETQPGMPAPNRSHAVTLSTEGGTATADVDFAPVDATLTFAPEDYAATDGRWVARKSVALPLVDDDDDEHDEQLTLTLSRDASLGDLIQVRNPNRTRCEGPCRATVTITDDDVAGVSFLDGDGNPLADLRLTVREGEQVTYQIKLDRRPAQWGILVWEPGEGDADLVPQGDHSWPFSPDLDGEESQTLPSGPVANRNAHHWQEAFSVTVEALQDNDPYPGERRFHHYLVSGDHGQSRIALPDIVVVEVDDEGSGPLGVFGAPEVISEPVSGDTYEVGEHIEIRIVFTRPVTVTGSPYLEFDLGSPDAPRKARANYAGGGGTQDLVFGYTVRPDDRDEDGIEIPAGAIHLNDGTIQGVETGAQAAIEYAASGVQAAHRVRGPAALAVADAQTRERADATLDFAVTLNRAVSARVMVAYATADGTATADQDYTEANGTLTFAAGQTRKSVSVAVLDDAIDEGAETLTLTLSDASGALIVDDTATGTIVNSDPMPKALLARFGRTVASQAVEAIGGRLQGSGGSHVTVGGQSLDLSDSAAAPAGEGDVRGALEALGAGEDAPADTGRGMTGRALLLGSSFHLSSGGEAGGPAWTAWGRAATGGFEAEVDDVRMDASVTSGFLGADVGTERWLAGVALSVSDGDGDYVLLGRKHDDSGTVESSLTAFYPYAQLGLTETVNVWGFAGYGEGDLTLTQHPGTDRARRYETDIGMRMVAVGARGEVLSPSEPDGLAVALKSDAFWAGTSSRAVPGMAGSEADVSRVRLTVEGARSFATGSGVLTPSLELGVRHDGGDAETGTGLEVGAGLRYSGGGVTIEGSVRTLVAHQEAGYEEWGASGAIRIDPGSSGEGLSLTLAPVWGAASGGTERLWSPADAQDLAPQGDFEAGRRLEAEVGYGLDLGRAPGVLTPYAGLGWSDGGRVWRTGARWQVAPGTAVSLEGTREEAHEGTAEHGLLLRSSLSW